MTSPMTSEPTTLSIEDLKAWLELLPKVTPGPWFTTGAPWFASSDGVLAGSPDGNIAFLIADCDDCMSPREEYAESNGSFPLGDKDADAAHLAKCDPATIAALIEGYIAMAEALSTFTDEHDNTCDGDPIPEGESVFISKARFHPQHRRHQ